MLDIPMIVESIILPTYLINNRCLEGISIGIAQTERCWPNPRGQTDGRWPNPRSGPVLNLTVADAVGGRGLLAQDAGQTL